MFRIKYIILLSVLVFLKGCKTSQNEEELKDRIDTYLEQGVKNGYSGSVLLAKDGQNAIICFEKALELKPEENCYWCANSESRLNQLK